MKALFKVGDVLFKTNRIYRIITKVFKTKNGTTMCENFCFIPSYGHDKFEKGTTLGELYLKTVYKKAKIKDLPEDIKEAYIKWKLDQL